MIKYIYGTYTMSLNSAIVIETGSGIGFEVNVPSNSLLYKNKIGDQIRVYTYMLVKEDGVSLFGFDDIDNLRLFQLLITVNGVGPKAAISIMSSLTIDDLNTAIAFGDAKAIAQANGIGKKTADRIILELKDKISSDVGIKKSESEIVSNDNKTEAINALIALGYNNSEAFAAVSKVNEDNLSCEEIIKKALKNLF